MRTSADDTASKPLRRIPPSYPVCEAFAQNENGAPVKERRFLLESEEKTLAGRRLTLLLRLSLLLRLRLLLASAALHFQRAHFFL